MVDKGQKKCSEAGRQGMAEKRTVVDKRGECASEGSGGGGDNQTNGGSESDRE